VTRKPLTIVLVGFLGAAAAADEVRFTSGPTATRTDGRARIGFAVSEATDVEVAILDAKGEVVRHLAAGLLGPNAPEPLRRNSLSQEVRWDGKDDAGRPAKGGQFKARVALGLKGRFDKIIGWSGENIDRPRGMVCGPDGTLYALWGGGYRAHRQTTLITAHDREGRYLRQVFPGPANLPPEKRAGWPRVRLDDGTEVPVVFHVTTRCPYPGAVFGSRVFPAVTADRRLVILSGTGGTRIINPDTRGGRRLLILGCDGSVPKDFLGPVVAKEKIGGFGHVALSPDDTYAYVAGLFEGGRKGRGPCQVVWRVRLDGSTPAKVFAGTLYAAAKGKAGLNDPQGLATDKAGNLYIADYGNNRIAVFKPDGKFLDEIPIDHPDQVRVSCRTGAIYVMTIQERKKPITDEHWYVPSHNWRVERIVKFASLKDKAEQASLPTARGKAYGGGALLALDEKAEPPVLWFIDNGWGRRDVMKVIDRGAALEPVGDPIHSRVTKDTALPFVGAVAATGKKVLVRRRVVVNRPVVSLVFDADTGLPVGTFAPKDENGKPENYWTQVWTSQVVGQHDTRFYVHGGNQTGRLRRYDMSGKAAPFQATGSHVLTLPFPDRHTHNTTLFATPAGDVYMALRKEGQGQAGAETVLCVTAVGPDGKIKNDCLVSVQSARLGGLAVDSKGNIYLGAQVTPKDARRIPPWFAGKLPADTARGRRHPGIGYKQYGAILKFGPAGGRVMIDPNGEFTGRRTWQPKTVSVKGTLWMRRGGLIPANEIGFGCNCETTRFDLDRYDRLFVPDVFRFSVRVLDAAGNEITHFGAYGNMDSRGPKSPVPTPAIAFGWPISVECAGGRVFVADLVNRRVVAVRLEHAVSEECPIAK